MTDCFRVGLSCDPVRDTMSVCTHGFPIKLGNCFSCAHEHRLIQLESGVKRLEEILPRYHELHKEWMDRIEKLENKSEPIFTSEIQRDVTHLLNRVYNLEQLFYDEKAKFRCNDKKPHKCPVCDGDSKIEVMHALMEPFEKRIVDSQGRHFVLCHSCDGIGIVWG